MTGFSVKFEYCVSGCRGHFVRRGACWMRVSCNGCPLLWWQAVSHEMTQPKICAPCLSGHRASSDNGKALRSGGIKAVGLGPTSLTNGHS